MQLLSAHVRYVFLRLYHVIKLKRISSHVTYDFFFVADPSNRSPRRAITFPVKMADHYCARSVPVGAYTNKG